MNLRDRINQEPSQQIPLRKIETGKRRRERKNVKPGLAGLKTSMEEIGMLHPIVIGDDFQLAAGHRRMIAAEALGWRTIKAVQLKLTEEDRQTIELDENEQRTDLDAYEASLERLEDMAVLKAAHLEKIEEKQTLTQKAAAGTKNEDRAERRARAASSSPRSQQSEDRKIIAVVKDHPFLKQWTRRTMMAVNSSIFELPEREHAGAERLISGFNNEIDAAATDSAKQKIMAYGAKAAKNLDRFSAANRAWIYKLASNGSAKNAEEARQVALGIPPSSDPRIHYVAEALDALEECLLRNKQQDSTNATIRDCRNMLTTVVKQLEGTFDKMMREYLRKTPEEVRV